MGTCMPEKRIIIIGGGAAGMMASIFAARAGATGASGVSGVSGASGVQVTLLERGEKLGKKVYITGKGRCNVTNDCTMDEFLREVPRNPRFLYSALSFFSPQDMMQLLEDGGCPVVVQRGRRVFPSTEKASDVTRTLQRLMNNAGVSVRYGARVSSLLTESPDGQTRVTGVRLQDGTSLPADRVIIATGGLSCPLTGSAGDGYRLAEQVGHTVLPRSGVLSAIETEDQWCAQLQGLSLKNVTLTLKKGKKQLYSELGEMLFTHFGISGPLVLTMSCHLPDKLSDADVTLDLKPGLTAQQLDARLQRELAEDSRRQLRNMLPHLLPGSFAELFPALCGIDGDKVCAQVTREEREKIAAMLKALPIHLKRLAPIEEAIVTRGGISVKEVAPATMESRLVKGLYFAGEVLDVDAHTGGYNLQIAWSTGALAGESAAKEDV